MARAAAAKAANAAKPANTANNQTAPSVPNKGGASNDTGMGAAGKALTAGVAVNTLKGNNNYDDLLAQQAAAQGQQGAAAAQQGAAPVQPGAAPQAVAQTAAPMAPLPLSKMEKIIKHVTSRAYPYRCSVFAGDYCRRLCTRICVPPL
jgi:hypothetical protein